MTKKNPEKPVEPGEPPFISPPEPTKIPPDIPPARPEERPEKFPPEKPPEKRLKG